MRSGSARSAEQRYAAIMGSVITAALIDYKQGRDGIGGKTVNDVNSCLDINMRSPISGDNWLIPPSAYLRCPWRRRRGSKKKNNL